MQGERPDIALPRWESLPDIGLYMDQVVTLMERAFSPALPKGEMTKSMVNNYVKVGLIPRPSGKKYDREHLAMLMMIGVLKQALSMESIAQLLDMLCADGVRKGYERFCEEAAVVGEVPACIPASVPRRIRRCARESWQRFAPYAPAGCLMRCAGRKTPEACVIKPMDAVIS